MAPKRISKSAISAPTPTTISATAYKFQLPALDIPKASLTEGTPIPPPTFEHSPPISPPQTPISTDSPNPLRSHPTSSHSLTRKFSGDTAAMLNGHNRISPPRSIRTSTPLRQPAMTPSQPKRSYTPTPASPTAPPSKRPHIRKLLSLKSLASLNRSSASVSNSNSYEKNGYSVEIRSQSPAPSTSTSMSTLSKLKRRSSGAFWRRNSTFGIGMDLVDEENDVPMDTGEDIDRNTTPPPTLPEFDSLGGGLETEIIHTRDGGPTLKRQASGWFGGDKIFEGIGRR